MFADPRLHALLPPVALRDGFLAWLRHDADALVAAAKLLGGARWAARAAALTAEIRPDDPGWRAELRALRGLLHLERVDRLDSEEALRFAALHPDDPRADAARLCAEALDRGLEALARCAAETPGASGTTARAA